jgi:hypothetical protein
MAKALLSGYILDLSQAWKLRLAGSRIASNIPTRVSAPRVPKITRPKLNNTMKKGYTTGNNQFQKIQYNWKKGGPTQIDNWCSGPHC